MKNVFTAFFSVVLAVHAAVYIVPKNGPRTIDSVNALPLHSGDSVLFERGGVYRGTVIVKASGSAGLPITFAPYGAGAIPIISGSVPITGWTSGTGNVQQASVTQDIHLLFSDDIPLTLARYPNHGYRTISDSLSETVFRDTGIDASKNWTGAPADHALDHLKQDRRRVQYVAKKPYAQRCPDLRHQIGLGLFPQQHCRGIGHLRRMVL
jgi:hypothetical protein